MKEDTASRPVPSRRYVDDRRWFCCMLYPKKALMMLVLLAQKLSYTYAPSVSQVSAFLGWHACTNAGMKARATLLNNCCWMAVHVKCWMSLLSQIHSGAADSAPLSWRHVISLGGLMIRAWDTLKSEEAITGILQPSEATENPSASGGGSPTVSDCLRP